MGAVEDAVDAAADFVGPFLGNEGKGNGAANQRDISDANQLVERALSHVQAINAAEKAADPDAPYDASLVGIVYGLLDLITLLGILPHLSPGVAFGQRPRSVLIPLLPTPSNRSQSLLSNVLQILIPILEQNGTGVQPLLSQRSLPDILSALVELSFSPQASKEAYLTFEPIYMRVLSTTPTSRLLPILTSFLQQPVPSWLRPRFSKELALVPIRTHGVRHTIEFLSLSFLSKNSQVPQDASGSQAQLPLPLEAITQASRLLVSVPVGMNQDEWFTQLVPQIWTLLDGSEGKELSRAAGQIIAGGILNRKSTGAPGTIGWELFARPLLEAICPKAVANAERRQSTADQVIVSEQDLKLSLKRVATIVSSYSHAGLIKRLVGPIVLSLWGLLTHCISRTSLDKEWSELSRAIMLRYFSVSCEPVRIDAITLNLFWDGEPSWTFGPGSQGGVEIRRRSHDEDMAGIGGILSRIGQLDERVKLLVSLLGDANIDDQVAGAIFLQTTKKWLSPTGGREKTLIYEEPDADPLSALTNAKLSEAMATKFKDKFARSPQHIIELMGQLLQNFVREHQAKSKRFAGSSKPSRANLGDIVQPLSATAAAGTDTESEDLVSFALSILLALITSSDFNRSTQAMQSLESMRPSLEYLSRSTHTHPIPPLIVNAATNVLRAIQPSHVSTAATDPQAQHRETLKTIMADLTSPEAPNRTWAVSTLRKFIQDPTGFALIDIPSTAHMLLSASIADPESYVHTAAIPVLADLAARAPNPTVRILVDAWVDVDERSLRLKKEKEIEEALDYRLRVGEILSSLISKEDFWHQGTAVSARFTSLKMMVEAALSLASRRGQRKQTLAARNALAEAERKQQAEGEEAWGGPIPNLLDPEAGNPAEQAERDALLKIVQGWKDTGIEEDVRIRASALSILSGVLEKRLELLSQSMVDASLQMVLMILTVETGEAKGIVRRAAVLVVMGLLRGMDALLEEGKESGVGMGMRQMDEIERVVKWVKGEDVDGLVRDHATSVLEGLETWRMKKLYRIRDEGLRLGPDLGLEGNLRGLEVRPLQEGRRGEKRGPVVEEIE